MVTSEAVFSPQISGYQALEQEFRREGGGEKHRKLMASGPCVLIQLRGVFFVLFALFWFCLGYLSLLQSVGRLQSYFKSPGQLETEAEDRGSPFRETKHGAVERERSLDM